MNNRNRNHYLAYSIGFLIILALPLFVAPTYFNPVDWGKTIVFRSILAILLFLFVFQLLYRKNEIKLPDIRKNKIIRILALFSIVILLSTLFSQDINFSLWGSPYRAEGAINLFFYIIFAIMAFLIIKPVDWNKVLNISILAGVLVCFIAVIQFYSLFSNIFIPNPGRPSSTMGNPIMLGIYLLLLFFITLSSAIKEKKTAYRGLYIFALLTFFLTILITGSRAAYLGLILGGIYFFLFYPVKNKKILVAKTSFTILLILGLFSVYYVNSQKSFPNFLENNKIFEAVQNRLSIKLALSEPRFSAWQVVTKAIKEKPVFGWGPENLAIGFDKNYNPSLPYINKDWGGWWDRAHNIILDTAATSGIPAAIIYLTLLITLFCQLQKAKKSEQPEKTKENPIVYHGIQATLIAYFSANLLSFDGFSSYFLFFLIIGYSLYLTFQQDSETEKNNNKTIRARGLILSVFLILLVIFIWRYNILPLKINAQINKADNLADDKRCDQALLIAENNMTKNHSFLDAYAIIHYIEKIKKCAELNPEKNLEYAEKGAEAMKNAVKIRPMYSRLWIFLGSFTTIKASAEQNPDTREDLISEAKSYLVKASELAPKHQEILIEQAKTDMVAGDYKAMKEKAEKCITLDSSLGECYWTKALSEIYLKQFEAAKENTNIANNKLLNASSASSLQQLANAYATMESYDELAIIYKKLIEINPNVAQYHSSLAFTYSRMGEYKKARQEAMIFLELMPEEKDEVDAFLKMLR